MTQVQVLIDGNEESIYIDNTLFNGIERKIKPSVQTTDNDWVCIIDGEERSGKSVFAQQLAKILDPNFNLNKICMNGEEFTKAIVKANKGDCIVYDEAFTGLSSRSSLTEVNRLLVSLMMEMGQKNLYIVIVMPTFFMLDRYVVLHRARCLFHIYKKSGKRGFWAFFNKKRLKFLYLKGKKLYSYREPKANLIGKFFNKYAVNEIEYRAKKKNSLNKKSRVTKNQVVLAQRNALIYEIYNTFKKTQSEISKMLSQYNLSIARNTLSEIITSFEKQVKEGKDVKDIEINESDEINENEIKGI